MKRTTNDQAAGLAVLFALVLVAQAAASESGPLPQLAAGQSLESALASLNAHGYRIAYSSALVHADMRLVTVPDAQSIDQLLVGLLSPWGLVARQTADGAWHIVRAPPPPAGAGAGARTVEAAQLSAIDVTASRFGLMDAESAGTLFLDRSQIVAFPHLTDDAFRVLRVLPGISGGDFSARMHLRGGRRDEVMLRVDGVEMHDPFHLRDLDGPIGLLDTNLAEQINLTTGGPTADFGGRMSGLVDIATRTPQASDIHRHAIGVSFVNAFARTTGRFADERGFYVLSVRRGYLDLVLERVADGDEEFAPRYQDVLARAGFAPGERTQVTVSALLGSDDMTYVTDDDDESSAGDSDTAHFWLTLDHQFESGIRVHSVAAAGDVNQSRVAFEDDPGNLFADLDMSRDISFTSFRQDWSWQASDRHLFRWGASTSRYRTDYDYSLVSFILDPVIAGSTPIDNSHSADLVAHSDETGVYAAWRSRLADGLHGELGMRWDRYGGDLDASRFSPRFNLVYDPGGSRQYRLALSRVHQPQRADELQVEDDVATFFDPERVDQLSFGLTQRFGETASMRIDAYVKRYDDLRPRFENLLDSLELINEAEPDRVRVDASEARAHGIEVSLQAKPAENMHLWASYVYSRSEDKMTDAWYRRLWDQPHAITAGYAWTGSQWHLSVAANWHTGWPTTPVTVEESVNENGETVITGIVGRRNSERLDSFARVDLRASRTQQLERGSLSWYFEVYNLFNARNPCCVEDFDLVRNKSGILVARPNEDYWMPILPSFGIQYEF